MGSGLIDGMTFNFVKKKGWFTLLRGVVVVGTWKWLINSRADPSTPFLVSCVQFKIST
jgi:hypothetical protein